MYLENTYVRCWRFIHKTRKLIAQILGYSKGTYVWHRLPYYKEIWKSAAKRNQLQFVELTDDVWELRDSDNQCVSRINNCYVELDDPVTLHIAGNKELTYQLLESASIPVAPHVAFTLSSLELLKQFVNTHDGPFVTKPAAGTGSGIGVSTHLYTYKQCLRGSALASLYCNRILVEEFVPGEVYRLLFVDKELISVVRRTGIRVRGDGTSNLEDLVHRALQQQENKPVEWDWNTDLDLRATTSRQGLAPSVVLSSGRDVLVKSVSTQCRDNEEIRTVYTEDVTGKLGDNIIEQARKACTVLRSEFCGVDLILLDPDAPLRNGNGIIGEVNTTPGLHHHYDLPGSASSKDATDAVLQYIVKSREI